MTHNQDGTSGFLPLSFVPVPLVVGDIHNQGIPLLRLLCARHRRRADCEWWRTANVVGAIIRLIGGVSDY